MGPAETGQTAGVIALKSPISLRDMVMTTLDQDKAEDIVSIDLEGKTAIADYMVIASGRSQRHVGALADQILRVLKSNGYGSIRAEGQGSCDWVLIDATDVIIHIFRPEVREFYSLEKMWMANIPPEQLVI